MFLYLCCYTLLYYDFEMLDFVLVWEEPVNQAKPDEPEDKSSNTTNDIHRKWRTEFLSRLQTAGLHQEMVSIKY